MHPQFQPDMSMKKEAFFYNTKYIVQETKWIKKLFGMAGGFHYTEGGSITYYISQIEYLWIHG